MAQLLTLRLTRNDSSTSWGFRLQGGKDFGTPLLIQKVNVGSLAEKAGLQVGDAVIRVNGKEVADVRHKDAQDVIVRAGNVVEFTIQRGGTATWKPSVTPVGSVPSPNPYISTSPSPITKTSLAASPHQSPRIPQGFNSTSKPFSAQQTNGGYVNENGSIKAIVNKQYNTPVGIYSDESIAETLSAQAEVLAGGVLGVNFKKNEKNYNAENSEVFKMVLEAEKEPKSPEPERPSSASYFASHSHAVGGQATSSRPQTPIAALLDRPRSRTSSPIPPAPKASSSASDNLSCSECRQNIVGVFVRIKEKNLHVECFKCATCGTSLKNVGYYSINNKLYCDIHAKMVARQNPPAPNLEPITVSPSQQGASKIISTALIANSNSASLSPQPTLAPVPFHPPRQSPTHVSSPVPHSQQFSAVNGSKSYSPSNTFSNPISAPKPGYFQSPKAMPFSKVAVDTHKPSPVYSTTESQHVSYYSPSQKRLPFLKPRAEKASAFMPVMKSSHSKPATCEPTAGHADQSKLSTVFESLDQDDPQATACHRKKLSICSQEVKSVFSKHLACSPAPGDRPESPVPSESADEFQHYETPRNKPLEMIQSRPHSVRSLSPCERPATPSQIVVFPPEMPDCYHPRIASPLPIYSKPPQQPEPVGENEKSLDTGVREVIEPENPKDEVECVIERTRETLTITCASPAPETRPDKSDSEELQEVTLQSLPRPVTPSGYIASLLTTASDRPFTPIEPAKATIFTEPVPLPPETIPYFPTSKEENQRLPDLPRPVSPMTFALTTAPERSYSPLPTVVKFEDLFPPGAESPPAEEPKRPSLADALTVAPKRSYTPLSRGIAEQIKEDETDVKVPDLSEDPSVILTKPMLDVKKPDKDAKKFTPATPLCPGSALAASPFYVTEAAFPPICDELKAKFEKRLRTGSISDKNVPKNASGVDAKQPSVEKRHRSPFTSTGLYKPINLPHYQQCVKELTSRNKTPLSRRNTPTPKGPESRKNTPTPRSELSRKNTPTPRGDACRKSTPVGFEATVSTQQKIFHPEPAQSGVLKTSALSFLTQTKDISEKIPPVLGYQPGPIVENMSSYTKVEQCVRTVCEKTLKQIQSAGLSVQSCASQSSELHVTKTNRSSCSSPINTPSVLISKAAEDSAVKPPRSSTPIKKTSRPSTPISHQIPSAQISQPKQTTPTQQQVLPSIEVFQQRSNVTATSSQQCVYSSSSQTKSMAALNICSNLSKTLTAIASKHQSSNISSKNLTTSTITSSDPNLTGSNVGVGSRAGTSAGLSAPRRGRGVWNPQNMTPGARIPLCAQCSSQIRGPFITALGKIWCPEHFICVNKTCRRSLLDIGFVEEPSGLHCEYCFEKYLAPSCGKCSQKIKGDCLNAIGKHFHPECFVCAYCNKLFGNSPFFLEEGLPYCENDWNELFTTKCFACGFPIEAGDRWVEALNNNYHSPCFNCTSCKTNLEGQSFYAKGGRPFCKSHAR